MSVKKMKGRTPCLIGTTHGTPRFKRTGTKGPKRKCKRCKNEIDREETCVEVSIPGGMGHITYCSSCFEDILGKTAERIDELRAELRTLIS